MAGFSTLDIADRPVDSGTPNGKMYHIACKTWFTATGNLMPLSFKFEGDDGSIQCVPELQIKYSEEKNYSGIPSREYGCSACIGGMLLDFRLIFYMEACKWVMVI